MAVVVNIKNPGALVDKTVGVDGVGNLVGDLGLGGFIGKQVDEAAADKIRDALSLEGVEADVYTTASPPSGGEYAGVNWTPIVLVLAAGVAAYLILE